MKKKDDKNYVVQLGLKGHIIPLDLVIEYKLKDLKDNVLSKENNLNDINSRIDDIFENLSDDEKSEVETVLNDENDSFVPGEIAKKAKEFLKQTISEGTVEKKIIEVNNLFNEQKRLTKEIKSDRSNLEVLAAKEIENLSKDDIDELLFRKWIEPIVSGMDIIIDNLIIKFSKDIENLSVKYKQTLKDINDEISHTEKELIKMINQLTGNEFDMKGLDDLKSLLGVNNDAK